MCWTNGIVDFSGAALLTYFMLVAHACRAKCHTSKLILRISWIKHVLDKWHRGFLRRGPLDIFHACREKMSYVYANIKNFMNQLYGGQMASWISQAWPSWHISCLSRMFVAKNVICWQYGMAREPDHEVAGRFPIRSLALRVARKLPTLASFQRCHGQRDDTMRNTAVSVLAQRCSFSCCRHSSSCIPHRTVIMIWWVSRCLQMQKTRLWHGRLELR